MEGASLGCVAPDQSFGRLHSDLGSLVRPGVVGSAYPVDDPELLAEGLHLPGGEHTGAITGEHHWDPEDGHVGAEDIDDLLTGVPVQLEHGEPVAVSINYGQVGVRGDGEEVCTDGLEGVAGLIRGDRGHGRVAWLVLGAGRAGGSVVDEVYAEVGPVEGGGGPLEHSCGALVASMEMVHDAPPQGGGDDRPVMEQDDRAHCGEGVPVGVELLDLLVPGSLVVRDAELQGLVEHGVLGAGDAGRLQSGPGDGLWAILCSNAINAGPGVYLCHAGHRVPHQQVLGGVGDGGYGGWRDPAGLAKVLRVLGGDIGLSSPVHLHPAGGGHDGGVGPPGHGVRDDVLLARNVVDGEPVSHGLQLVIEEPGVVDGLQGFVCTEYGQ